MNEIFININDKFDFVYLIFDNFKNELIFFKEIYKFTFISKNKLRIFNSKIDVTLITYDSYIYSDNENHFKYFKLIELIHNDWYDQCLLNYKTKQITRIKDRDQKGTFEMKKDNLDILWERWGNELFIYKEENIFVQENYHYEHLNLNNINYEKKNKILIFIHCCALENGLTILSEQLEEIIKNKLYDECEKIIIHILGQSNYDLIDIYKEKNKIEFIYSNLNVDYYEMNTINCIKKYFENIDDNYNVLYIHTKGVNKSGNQEVIQSWRNMMEYNLINQFKFCNYLLNNEIVNTIGNNIINTFLDEKDKIVLLNKNHCFHYSGNFWWASSHYIKKLDFINIESEKENRYKQRYQAENWILSKKEIKKTGILYQNNTNLHPYHRFIFYDYRNKNIYLKLI